MTVTAGRGTGWVAGHLPALANATWLLWSATSRCLPSQQLPELTWSRRLFAMVSGQVGTVDEAAIGTLAPQFQNVTRSGWAAIAWESPATARNPAGNGRTGLSVLRR